MRNLTVSTPKTVKLISKFEDSVFISSIFQIKMEHDEWPSLQLKGIGLINVKRKNPILNPKSTIELIYTNK